MKVLVRNAVSFICSRLTVYADYYRWSARTDKAILISMLKYLNVPPSLWYKQPSHMFVENIIKKLSPQKIRRILQLCELLLKFPEMFDRMFSCFNSVPIIWMDRILMRDIKHFNGITV
jgi:hypothetical protein